MQKWIITTNVKSHVSNIIVACDEKELKNIVKDHAISLMHDYRLKNNPDRLRVQFEDHLESEGKYIGIIDTSFFSFLIEAKEAPCEIENYEYSYDVQNGIEEDVWYLYEDMQTRATYE